MKAFLFLTAWLAAAQAMASIEDFQSLIEENCHIQQEFAKSVLNATPHSNELKNSVHTRTYKESGLLNSQVGLVLYQNSDSH